jgi:hypothetical protein
VILKEFVPPEFDPGLSVDASDDTLKKFNLFLGAAWMPSVTFYDVRNRFIGNKWSPAGAAVHFGLMSTKRSFFNFGAELTASWCFINTGTDGNTAHFLLPTINFLLQKWSPSERTALTFRLGAGYSIFLYSSNMATSYNSIHLNIGVSYLFIIRKDIYLEVGIDYTDWLAVPVSGSFRPWLGLGWRFY